MGGWGGGNGKSEISDHTRRLYLSVCLPYKESRSLSYLIVEFIIEKNLFFFLYITLSPFIFYFFLPNLSA